MIGNFRNNPTEFTFQPLPEPQYPSTYQARRIKMFRGHIQGLILLLKKMTEEKKTGNNKVDRNGIRIISEGPSALFETLEELKNHFLENGYHTIPRYLYRD